MNDFEFGHLTSEENTIVQLFGFSKFLQTNKVSVSLLNSMKSNPNVKDFSQDFYQLNSTISEYSSKINEWINNNELSKEIIIRYMILGLQIQISTMRKFQDKSFSEIVNEFKENPDIKIKFDLFSKYYGRFLNDFHEYYKLFTNKELHQLSSQSLFNYVLKGTKDF